MPEAHGRKRWCTVCADLRETKPNQYANAFGVWSIQHFTSTQTPAKIVARTSFLLDRVVPDDAQAWLELAGITDPLEGRTIAPAHIVLLFLGHAFKWPPVLRRMFQWVKCTPASRIDAETLVDLCKDMRDQAHGQAWPAMFSRMHFSLMYAVTGLQPTSVKLRMTSPIESA